jgi:hypothetical protein
VSAICSVVTEWSQFRRTRNHTLVSHLRLPQPGGPASRIYIPQEQGGPVILPGIGFPLRRLLRLASDDSQAYGVGILTLPQRGIYIVQEHDGPVYSQSQKPKSRCDRRPVNQYVLVPSPLGIKGVPSEKFQFNIYFTHHLLYIVLGRPHKKTLFTQPYPSKGQDFNHTNKRHLVIGV